LKLNKKIFFKIACEIFIKITILCKILILLTHHDSKYDFLVGISQGEKTNCETTNSEANFYFKNPLFKLFIKKPYGCLTLDLERQARHDATERARSQKNAAELVRREKRGKI